MENFGERQLGLDQNLPRWMEISGRINLSLGAPRTDPEQMFPHMQALSPLAPVPALHSP